MLILAATYFNNGTRESFPVLMTRLISDLWLAKSSDNGEMLAAARVLRALWSLWGRKGCTAHRKYPDFEIVNTIKHRAIVFSKKVNYLGNALLVRELLGRLLGESHSADNYLIDHPDWNKHMQFLSMATVAEPDPEYPSEQSVKGRLHQRNALQQAVSDERTDTQILETKHALCCSLIRRRDFQYGEALMKTLVPELESLLPRKPCFVINCLAEVASSFAKVGGIEEAKKQYTRAKIACHRMSHNNASCCRCNGRAVGQDVELLEPGADQMDKMNHEALERLLEEIYQESWKLQRLDSTAALPSRGSPSAEAGDSVSYLSMLSKLPGLVW